MYQIDFHKPIAIHFIGIGGISMSGLAEVLLEEGFTISGSDAKKSPLTTLLEEKGATLYYGQRASNIKDSVDVVVYTAAIHPDNPEFACAKEKVDFVIAIGGGSPMDSAKAIALLAVSDIERKNLFDGNIGNKALPMIHIPTTAGTGSEVTPYAILTNHEKQTKKSIASPCLFPTYALLDAKYTKNLGLATTVNTAIDSLSHSVEGMMSKRANIMADVIAKEAVKIIASTFDDLISGELTEDDREKLLYASMLGGVVISQTKTTAVHAMGYSLTYFKNIDHGRANGLLLGEFTKYIERNDKDRVKEILSCMNLDSAEEFKNILAKILGDKEKFEKEELELYAEIAQNAGGTLNSMFVPSKDEILQIYVESLM